MRCTQALLALSSVLLLGACGAPAADNRTESLASAAAVASSFVSANGSHAMPAHARAASPTAAPRDRAPEYIRGLYVTAYTAASKRRMPQLLALADSTEINTFVVDVKDENGILYLSDVPLVRQMGLRTGHPIHSLKALADTLRAHDIYAIARIVVFKDPILSKARPDWSIRTPTGALWRDKVGNTWVSPWDQHVWDYNIAIAEEAARAGFPEVQFDYVRFPEAYKSLPRQVHPGATGSRTDAISGFLTRARDRLHPLGAVVGADLFGLSMNDAGDVEIGQQWETLSGIADHLLPMVYPSHYFPTHLPGVPHPNRMPYEAIRTAVGMGVIRNDRLREAGVRPARTIPWLQAFNAPWVDRNYPYGPQQATAQMQGVYDVGLEDWIFWNAASRYENVQAAFDTRYESHAKIFTPPHRLVAQVNRFEGWGMREARQKAVARAGVAAGRTTGGR
jgi:hypothetical protein